MGSILDLFLEKTPKEIDIDEIKEHILSIEGVDDIHHIHIWSMDGFNALATMHIVTTVDNIAELKKEIREELAEHGISHAILETESEVCDDTECHMEYSGEHIGGHNHHH
jgi:cobalt-zinc-cadmium efflux system protein